MTDTTKIAADVMEELQTLALKKLLTDDPAAFEAKMRRMVDAGEGDGWSRDFTAGILQLGAIDLGIIAEPDLWARVVAPAEAG